MHRCAAHLSEGRSTARPYDIDEHFGGSVLLIGGLSLGGLWSISDTLILTMPAESSPSGMRALVMGTISVMIGAGMFVGQALFIVLQDFISVDLLFLLICVPFMALSLLLLMFRVKETKGVDLDSITEDTYK